MATRAPAPSKIAILDFGGQYTQLIARRIRELGVYSEILPCTDPVDRVLAGGYTGIVLSGGPSSVYEDEAPLPDKRLLESGLPLLGICYGMQAMGFLMGGHVVPAERREYGQAQLRILSREGLLRGVEPEADGLVTVWMSHGDTVLKPPPGFTSLATTDNCPSRPWPTRRGSSTRVQFHPEVAHTPAGQDRCSRTSSRRLRAARADWSMPSFVDATVERIREQVGAGTRCSARSRGGVDSSVVAALIHRRVGDQLTCLFVDNGLLRKGEADGVVRHLPRRIQGEPASMWTPPSDSSTALDGVTDPEQKAQGASAAEFIAVFEDEARKLGHIRRGWPRARSIPT